MHSNKRNTFYLWSVFVVFLMLTKGAHCRGDSTMCIHNPLNNNQVTIRWDVSTQQQIAPRGERQLPYAGYPRVKFLRDGNMIALYEAQRNIELICSGNDGQTWSSPKIIISGFTTEEQQQKVDVLVANPEFIELDNGDWVVAGNYRPMKDGIMSFSIVISRSKDKGKSWSTPQIIFSAGTRFKDGCWEPALLQLPNGLLQVYFANEKPYTESDEQEISVIESKDFGVTWSTSPRTVCFRSGARDGMPVPLIVNDEILVAIEDNKDGQFKPYIVRSSVMDNWKEPVLGDSPNRTYALADSLPKGVYAGAPYIALLSTGQVILSYQTTKGRGMDWEKSTMEIAIGDNTGRNFRFVNQPFDVAIDREAKWNSIAVRNDNTIFALSATNFAGGKIAAWMVLGEMVVK